VLDLADRLIGEPHLNHTRADLANAEVVKSRFANSGIMLATERGAIPCYFSFVEVGMSLWNFGNSPLLSSRAMFLAEALLRGPDAGVGEAQKAPFCAQYGVFGAGLASFFGGFEGAFGVCILMDERLVPGPLFEDTFREAQEWDVLTVPVVRALPLTDVANAVQMMETLFGPLYTSPELGWIKSVAILAVPTPELNLVIGDQVSTTLSGLVGAPVAWSGNHGFLTAGHLGSKGTVVSDSVSTIGTIVFSSDPATKGGASSADVAVVELSGGPVTGSRPVTGIVHPGPAAEVDIHTQTGVQTISLMGETPYLNIPNYGMFGGPIYFTTSGVTRLGDSGGPVFEKGGTRLIGHVLGSSQGATSYFQDIQYQVSEIRQDPTFASLQV